MTRSTVCLFGSPFTFTGELLDANNLLYLRARYYNPALGVFTTLDPLENLNRYQYVGANPVNLVDPSGMIAGLLRMWDPCWRQGSETCSECLDRELDSIIPSGGDIVFYWPYYYAALQRCQNVCLPLGGTTPAISWPTASHLLDPSALLPRIAVGSYTDECVYQETHGTARRNCAARAYNAVWDQLQLQGIPMTWDNFFAITLQGEAGLLYNQNVNIIECGDADGNVRYGNEACAQIVNADLLLLERALVRQITDVCGLSQ